MCLFMGGPRNIIESQKAESTILGLPLTSANTNGPSSKADRE